MPHHGQAVTHEERKLEYPEKAPGDELQKMPHTKARRFKPQSRLKPEQQHWWQARKADVHMSLQTDGRGDFSPRVNMGSNSIPPKTLSDESINRGLVCAHMHFIARTQKILTFMS